jgi:hypothetical protein
MNPRNRSKLGSVSPELVILQPNCDASTVRVNARSFTRSVVDWGHRQGAVAEATSRSRVFCNGRRLNSRSFTRSFGGAVEMNSSILSAFAEFILGIELALLVVATSGAFVLWLGS